MTTDPHNTDPAEENDGGGFIYRKHADLFPPSQPTLQQLPRSAYGSPPEPHTNYTQTRPIADVPHPTMATPTDMPTGTPPPHVAALVNAWTERIHLIDLVPNDVARERLATLYGTLGFDTEAQTDDEPDNLGPVGPPE